MTAAMDGLEARKAELISLLAKTPQYVPDNLPSTSQIYAKKIARMTEALNRPEDPEPSGRSSSKPDRTDRSAPRPQPRQNTRDTVWRIGHDLGLGSAPRPWKVH